jgi:arylsulfatase A-like enzyme
VAVVPAAAAAQDDRPNIVIIMTDDHTTRAMSCYGNAVMETPNLDRLAREGMLFENCYVPNAISGPSRACIITGKYSHVNGFRDNSQTFDGTQQTWPRLLQAAGYSTAVVGKWHLESTPEGFDHWSILIGQGEYYAPRFIENGREIVEQGYVTDVITDKAIEYLEGRDPGKPFALMYYHKAPHRNWMPATRHLGLYDDKVFPEPDNLLDDYRGRGRAASEQEMEIGRDMWPEWDLKLATPSGTAPPAPLSSVGQANRDDVNRANDHAAAIEQFRAAYNRMTDREKALWDAAYAPRIKEYAERASGMDSASLTRWKYQNYMRDYCATVKAVDENVGRLVDYLESTGQIDNTIIVYTSDQGFFLGEHGWFDKRFMYEECFRTPLLVRYPPAVGVGGRSRALAMNIDFAPTFLDYAGVDIPADIQGRSLRLVLENRGREPEGWRTGVYYHYYEYPSWHSVKRHYGIRTRDWKLIHFYNDIDEWELYDMNADPREMNNLYDDPAFAGVREEMHRQLEQLQRECGDTNPTEL